jgi:membrane protease YdiL (CAAX protease family)
MCRPIHEEALPYAGEQVPVSRETKLGQVQSPRRRAMTPTIVDSSPAEASMPRRERTLCRALYLIFAYFPLCHRDTVLGPIGLLFAATLLASYWRCAVAAGLGLVMTLTALVFVYVLGFPPLAFGAGFAGLWLLSRVAPWSAPPATYLPRGRIDSATLAWCLACAAVAGSALVVWQRLMHPDLADLYAQIPLHRFPLPLLIAGAMAFAVANAAVEEAMYRGLLQHVLDRLAGRRWAWLLQALSFGLMHVHGFPRGTVGVVLATIYGLMMGAIRLRAGGLLAPWLAHTVTDITIVVILFTTAP